MYREREKTPNILFYRTTLQQPVAYFNRLQNFALNICALSTTTIAHSFSLKHSSDPRATLNSDKVLKPFKIRTPLVFPVDIHHFQCNNLHDHA
ncbi:hypothetical protein QQG55_46060 [Brugia pahangi]